MPCAPCRLPDTQITGKVLPFLGSILDSVFQRKYCCGITTVALSFTTKNKAILQQQARKHQRRKNRRYFCGPPRWFFGKPILKTFFNFLRKNRSIVHQKDITKSFPDLVPSLRMPGALDGELLVLREGRVQTFNVLQQRLNRKSVTPKLLKDYPIHLRTYDLLSDGNNDLRTLTFSERRAKLETFVSELDDPRIHLSPRRVLEGDVLHVKPVLLVDQRRDEDHTGAPNRQAPHLLDVLGQKAHRARIQRGLVAKETDKALPRQPVHRVSAADAPAMACHAHRLRCHRARYRHRHKAHAVAEVHQLIRRSGHDAWRLQADYQRRNAALAPDAVRGGQRLGCPTTRPIRRRSPHKHRIRLPGKAMDVVWARTRPLQASQGGSRLAAGSRGGTRQRPRPTPSRAWIVARRGVPSPGLRVHRCVRMHARPGLAVPRRTGCSGGAWTTPPASGRRPPAPRTASRQGAGAPTTRRRRRCRPSWQAPGRRAPRTHMPWHRARPEGAPLTRERSELAPFKQGSGRTTWPLAGGRRTAKSWVRSTGTRSGSSRRTKASKPTSDVDGVCPGRICRRLCTMGSTILAGQSASSRVNAVWRGWPMGYASSASS